MSTLGKNIKALRKEFGWSQNQLAEYLSVSQTSVAHYEAGTRQPTIETLIILAQLFDTSIDVLVGNTTVTKFKKKNHKSIEEINRLFIKYLIDKDEDNFIALYEEEVIEYFSIREIIDDIFKVVLYRVGDLWEQGLISVADEHYASNIVRKTINHLKYNQGDNIKHKKVVSFAIGSEQHTLGIEMINTYLSSVGIDTYYLGGNLPLRSMQNAISEIQPDFIFISVTLKEHMNSLDYVIDYINHSNEKQMDICIGGQGIEGYRVPGHFTNVHMLNDLADIDRFLSQK